jgi:hypothetical protein
MHDYSYRKTIRTTWAAQAKAYGITGRTRLIFFLKCVFQSRFHNWPIADYWKSWKRHGLHTRTGTGQRGAYAPGHTDGKLCGQVRIFNTCICKKNISPAQFPQVDLQMVVCNQLSRVCNHMKLTVGWKTHVKNCHQNTPMTWSKSCPLVSYRVHSCT